MIARVRIVLSQSRCLLLKCSIFSTKIEKRNANCTVYIAGSYKIAVGCKLCDKLPCIAL